MSSPEDPPQQPSADDVTDPALQAEIANPAESNVPTGADAGPGQNAADREDMPAAGAPAELSSDDDEAEAVESVAPATDSTASPGDETGIEGVQGADAVPKGPEQDGPASQEPENRAPGTQERVEPAEPEEPERLPVDEAALPDDATAVETPVEPEERADAATPPPPDPTPVELAEAHQELADALAAALDGGVLDTWARPGAGGDLWLRVAISDWRRAAEVCRNDLGLTYFCFLSAIDWLPSPFGKSEDDQPTALDGVRQASADTSGLAHGVAGGETRFQLLARLYSIARKVGVVLKADVADVAPQADTWTGIYPGANWHERETAEMYGIEFMGHPYPVKLYLPGAFEGFPLRKDFPLLAREVKPWPGVVDVEAMPGEPDDEDEPTDELAEAGAEA